MLKAPLLAPEPEPWVALFKTSLRQVSLNLRRVVQHHLRKRWCLGAKGRRGHCSRARSYCRATLVLLACPKVTAKRRAFRV